MRCPRPASSAAASTSRVQPKLTGALPGIRRFFETYPFICLEQKTSKSVGLKDAALWAGVANALPTYLDSDGLANYFPPRADDAPHGSDRLTAYVLAATHEAGFALPPAARDAMLAGLTAFVEGRIERKFWSPRADLDVRKLAAIEALSRYGRAQPKMLGSINVMPNTLADRGGDRLAEHPAPRRRHPGSRARLDEAQQILRARLTYAGTTLRFSTEERDFWWWLMDSADANAARLILAVLDDPAWKDDLPRMVVGSLGAPAQRRLADDDREPVGLARARQVLGEVRVDAGRRHDHRVALVRGARRRRRRRRRVRLVATWTRRRAARSSSPGRRARRPSTSSRKAAGKPWLTVQSLAAIPLKAPLRAGYGITRSVSAVEQKDKAKWSRGDVDARPARDRRAERHDLGRRQRPGAGRRDDPRQRPRPRLADRDARREAQRHAPGRRTRSAASRRFAATTSTCRAASTSSSTRFA